MPSEILIDAMDLEISGDVLPPWPSSRAFVEALATRPDWIKSVDSVIDMGCGAGIIGIAAAQLAEARCCVFVDIDDHAVTLAVRNGTRNGIDSAGWVSDVWQAVPVVPVDLIVCNPPFQPQGTGGRNLVDVGFRMHRSLFRGAALYLRHSGRMIVATSPAVSGGHGPEQIAAENGWTVADTCLVRRPSPSDRHPGRVHEYGILLLRPAHGRHGL